jgi:hypothetical protein
MSHDFNRLVTKDRLHLPTLHAVSQCFSFLFQKPEQCANYLFRMAWKREGQRTAYESFPWKEDHGRKETEKQENQR